MLCEKVVSRNPSTTSQQYGGGVKRYVRTERRSHLEEASDLGRSDVGAKTQEREREIGTKQHCYYLELAQQTLDDHTSLVFIPPR
jgi:hypothetical protein